MTGVLLLCDYERFFLKLVDDLPIAKQEAAALMGSDAEALARKLEAGWRKLDPKTIEQAYQAWMGYYNALTKRMGMLPP